MGLVGKFCKTVVKAKKELRKMKVRALRKGYLKLTKGEDDDGGNRNYSKLYYSASCVTLR